MIKKQRYFILLWLMSISLLNAQKQKAPFHYFLELTNLPYEEIQTIAPSFPDPHQYEGEKYTEKINDWAIKNPLEWQSFNSLNEVSIWNPNWTSYGLDSKLILKNDVFESSFWMWFKGSGISEGEAKIRFPHFPFPEFTGNKEEDLRNYNGRIGMWIRLYPKEYHDFINSKELMALVPSRTGPIQLPYIPKFLGAPIERNKPELKNTGNKIMDEYEYERAIRNWYFVFNENEFDRLYGKDFDFPESFDREKYRNEIITKITAFENGEKGEDDDKLNTKCKSNSLNEGTELK